MCVCVCVCVPCVRAMFELYVSCVSKRVCVCELCVRAMFELCPSCVCELCVYELTVCDDILTGYHALTRKHDKDLGYRK